MRRGDRPRRTCRPSAVERARSRGSATARGATSPGARVDAARAPERGARAARGRAGREGEGARSTRAGTSLGARARRALARDDARGERGRAVVDGRRRDAVEHARRGARGLWDPARRLGGGGDAADGEVLRHSGERGVRDDGGADAGDVGDDAAAEARERARDGVDGEIGDILGREGAQGRRGLAIRRREGQARGVRGVLVPPRRVGVGDVVTGVSVERVSRVNWWI